MKDHDLRKIRGNEISMIFQDPMTALNPVLRIGDQIAEAVQLHENCSKVEAMELSLKMLEMVGIGPERSTNYPHELSGGMKQRVVIAMALACNPALLIADEPTTALDVTIQAQVLNMMNDLKSRLGTSVLMITHDLGIIAESCDYVAVMYAGEIVEYGTLQDIFKATAHPYTVGLFNSIPSLDRKEHRLHPIAGLMPDPANLPEGCYFSPRCPYADEQCKSRHPKLEHLSDSHQCRCFHHIEKETEGT
jgi:peptide/nickel transport system ATP-binding protein